MASVRGLKKDIRFLSEVVIADAMIVGEMVEKKDAQKKVYETIVKAIDLNNELIARVNHPDGKDNPKLIKQYYKTITSDLMSGCDEMFSVLNGLLIEE